ncbi:glycerophosphodiester phosphodiesterase family protein [Granulosicoccus sp. 3-233]|uniref:glycerophosphodiester phosphodiesterase family protein n=1 Tax=Granulosicoccus sp. 3-233 TaxID=3417969 RepID=UPI003D354AD6
MKCKLYRTACLSLLLLLTACSSDDDADNDPIDTGNEDGFAVEAVVLGERPASLVAQLPEGELRSRLESCDVSAIRPQAFSIAHRGAPFQYPEHSVEGYRAAAEQGAGVIECDVTFTSDRELVCRHSQCDLHTTTDILTTDLAQKCTVPPDMDSATPYQDVQCCTSDLTLAEFRTLRAKRDGADSAAPTLAEYLAGTPGWTTDEATDYGTLITHRESIALFDEYGVAMTPELKEAAVDMPYQGDYTQAAYAQQLIDDYTAAGISADRVYPQSFQLEDVLYWITETPEFGEQAVFLDDRYTVEGFDPADATTFNPSMQELVDQGVQYLAPPIPFLVTLDDQQNIVPSVYASEASSRGLKLITWTLERSGSLNEGGGFYYSSVSPVIDDDGDTLRVLDVLARDVGVTAVFSDWPATTTFYSYCTDLDA